MGFKFSEEKTSDQKRLVRGEHLLMARTLLRERDRVHHRQWKILMLAGGSPIHEIRAIRELMPKAVVVAVDNDLCSINAAKEAGCDKAILCDLFNLRPTDGPGTKRGLPIEVEKELPIDVFDLDFCGLVSEEMKKAVSVYHRHLPSRGVMILTFSYGRDVQEIFQAELRNNKELQNEERYLHRPKGIHLYSLIEKGFPELVLGRLLFLLNASILSEIHSIMIYRGASMPMCSLLIYKGVRISSPSFVKVEHFDFDLAVTNPDPSMLYACPQDRIDSLRRKFAAIKAHLTMKSTARKEVHPVLFEPDLNAE